MNSDVDATRLENERAFHDKWAKNHVDSVDPVQVNTALTSPELRYIHKELGDVRGKKILDVGCGLGEASIYFVLRGAKVTATDLSQGMLDFVVKVAEKYGVVLRTHLAASEELGFEETEKFDVIYVGNLLHHVDIDRTIEVLRKHLANDGYFVSWDPIAYNPIINVYRAIASKVRTEDEHPLRVRDVRSIRDSFGASKIKFFWFTTLIVFIFMALIQFRNPNKVRFWKAVVLESDKWAWIYKPLEKFDSLLLRIFPFLGWLCWNIVIIGRNRRKQDV